MYYNMYAHTILASRKFGIIQLDTSMAIRWENRETGGNGMGMSSPIVRCSMGAAASQCRNGTVISDQTVSGREIYLTGQTERWD